MTFPNYSEYKKSDITWLGDIPSHWGVCRLKQIAAEISSGGTPDTSNENYWSEHESGIHWVSIGDMSGQAKVVDTEKKISNLAIRDKQLTIYPVGTLVYSIYASLGHVARLEVPAAINQALLAIQASDQISSKYLERYLQVIRPYLGQFSSSNTQHNLNAEKVRNFPVALPPIDEQLTIASFLDRETAKIDTLVAEQEKLIELLKEKRQAVISHAVTKGLDPKAPMKDSGVVWIGEVPTHWSIRRVKDVARLESGHTPSKSEPAYWENCDINWVSLNDTKILAVSDYISETTVKINKLGLANSSARMLPSGAVVFTRDATIGLAAITTTPMAVSQHLIAWCPMESILAEYLLRVVDAMQSYLDSFTFGATIKTIGMADIKKLATPLPPIDEQRAIIDFINVQKDRFENLVSDAFKSIEFLKERRSALISAAVTGKVDVRGLADVEAA